MTSAAENLETTKVPAKAAKTKAAAKKVAGEAVPAKTPRKPKAYATKPLAQKLAVASPGGHYEVSSAIATHSPIIALLLPDTDTDDRMEVFRATRLGFSLGSVMDLVESVDAFKRNNVLSRIVGLSDRTLARRIKNKDESLSQEQSARALYYAEVLEKAQAVFGTRKLAEEWMIKPALGLDGERPIDLLSNPVGYELVTDFLHRLEYGVY